MGSETSDQMMALLQELAALKGLDREEGTDPQKFDEEASRQRQQRHEEIALEMKSLAEQQKASRTDAHVSPGLLKTKRVLR